MLAPVLAQLEQLDGVLAAHTDVTGRSVFVTVEDAAGPGLETRVAQVLGPQARGLTRQEGEAQLVWVQRGDRLWGPEDMRALSMLEARILSVRIGQAAGAAHAWTEVQERRFVWDVMDVLATCFEAAHDQGGKKSTAWFAQAWPGLVDALVQRAPPSVQDALRPVLLRLF